MSFLLTSDSNARMKPFCTVCNVVSFHFLSCPSSFVSVLHSLAVSRAAMKKTKQSPAGKRHETINVCSSVYSVSILRLNTAYLVCARCCYGALIKTTISS